MELVWTFEWRHGSNNDKNFVAQRATSVCYLLVTNGLNKVISRLHLWIPFPKSFKIIPKWMLYNKISARTLTQKNENIYNRSFIMLHSCSLISTFNWCFQFLSFFFSDTKISSLPKELHIWFFFSILRKFYILKKIWKKINCMKRILENWRGNVTGRLSSNLSL